MIFFKKRFNLICGHYGVGKTNLALNLAIREAEAGEKVTLVDLDLVNPYFRSSDYAEKLSNLDIQVIAPVYANSNVDIPSLPAEINSIFDTDRLVIMDIGGDDVGATVLGRFSKRIAEMDYDMYYVINHYRNLTFEPLDSAQILMEIQGVSKLYATHVINNSHLKAETTADTVIASLGFADEVCKLLQLPLAAVTAPEQIAEEVKSKTEYNVLPVEVIVKTGWE